MSNLQTTQILNDKSGILLSSRYNKYHVAGLNSDKGYVLVLDKAIYLLVDGRYYLEYQNQKNNYLVINTDKLGLINTLNDIINRNKLEKIYLEDSIRLSQFLLLNDSLKSQIIPYDASKLREIKSKNEIALIKKAVAITDAAFTHIKSFIKVNHSELDIAHELTRFMQSQGALKESFDIVVASGLNSAFPHHKASHKKIAENDVVVIDFGCIYQLYCSDMTRTIFIHQGAPQLKELYNIVLQAQKEAIAAIKPGLKCHVIDDKARQFITKAGYGQYFNHNLGHGIGLEVHEKPTFAINDETILKPGMILSVEPGIYIEGLGGIRIEDLILVTQDGCEVLSKSSKQLTIINNDELFKAQDRYHDHTRKYSYEIVKEEFHITNRKYLAMWIADMDYQAPAFLREDLHQIIDHGLLSYTYIYQEFYDAIINYYKRRYQIKVSQDSIMLGYGSVSTLHYIIQSYKEYKVVTSTPVYGPFIKACTNNDVEVIKIPLINKDNRYYMDYQQIEKAFKEQNIGLYLLCNPHNPSGRIFSAQELKQLYELGLKYNVIIVSDEVHSGISNPTSFTSSLTLNYPNSIMISSANKEFNTGGLKTSFLIINNEDIKKKIKKTFTQNSITSPNIMGIAALISTYNKGDEYSKLTYLNIRNNYEYVTNYLKKYLNNVTYMEMESSYLIWLDIKATKYDSTTLKAILASQYQLLIEDGKDFYSSNNFIRLNLGTGLAQVKKAMKILKQVLSEH
ncbi:MAG: aminotransferase class I/II-fold pyridoxal phosphate-dependent enzyme [Bacilli bacterium]